MQPIPKIFISAASGDLRGVRQLVKEALLTINCHPVEQTNFEPDARTVADMLQAKISGCQALIHIVGLRYGAEPDPATLPPGSPRRSYTQMEYHIGRRMQEERGDDRFRVYTFICPENFPYDPEPDAEPEEKRALQRAHRTLLYDDPHLRESPKARDDIRHRILALQEQVQTLLIEQQETKEEIVKTRRLGLRAAALILLLLAAIGFGIHHLIDHSRETTRTLEAVHGDVTEVKSRFTKERKLMASILGLANEKIKDWENMTPTQRFDLALDQIAAEQKIPSKELRDLLDLYVQLVEADPDAEAEDKYYVLMHKQAFAEAARLAAAEGESAEARMKQHAARREAAEAVQKKAAEQEKAERLRAIGFYQKEGEAHKAAIRYEEALASYRKAAALTDPQNTPDEWFNSNNEVARMLFKLARYSEAEPVLKSLVSTARERHGEESTKHATSLNNLALLLKDSNRSAEAEPLFRRSLEIYEASFGKDHPNVAMSLNHLAALLADTNRHAEAEPLYRRALEISETSLGKDHPNVAISLNHLTMLLAATNRHAEAEPLMRRALEINEASFSKDPPRLNRHSDLYDFRESDSNSSWRSAMS